MSKYISGKDTKAKRTTLEFRNIDIGTDIDDTPSSMRELLATNRNANSITRYDFEVSKYGVTENILGEYIAYLTSPGFMNRVYFDQHQSFHLKFNLSALSQVLYGDINMAWSVTYLNDLIKHPSDLSADLLVEDGVLAFNEAGIAAIRELIKFKTINEQNEGNGDREAIFSLDAF